MASHVSLLFKMVDKLDGQSILQKARSKIHGSGVTLASCQQLENFLQEMFYGKNGTGGDVTNSLRNAAVAYLEQKHQQVFDSYDFEKNVLSTSGNNAGKIQLEGYTSFSHSKRVYYNTVYQRWWEAKMQLEYLSSQANPVEGLENIYSNLESLVSITEALLSHLPWIHTSSSGAKFFKVDSKTSNLIAEMDRLYQSVTFVKDLPLSLQDTGEIFERALAAVGAGSADSLTDELIMENFQNTTVGSQLTSRGELISCSRVEVIPKVKRNSEGQTTSVNYTVTGDGGSSYTIKGVFTNKQGKMDVQFTMPGSGQQFRISAKNWASLINRDFGDTSIEAALLRTAGLNPTLAYGLNLTSPNPLQTAHEFAKACIIVDILMGYSQKQNFADTVVINDRSHARIRVFSIKQILSKISLNNESITNYSSNTVVQNLQSALEYNDKLVPQNYISAILSTLSSIKVRVNSSILKFY